ncbi:hypothetical protein [Streptomyces botrytidirepellens]|uniref:ABM domain-containing protein n=1 Tax=Streptomyces botrytidirepellens TaxID=2486417 RepID=A0A3M8VYA0_9ACTN|nr:hypothetical protein [Streptomyces botrytidirepellens]RNG22300.1 hypothetical protein EEJ42_21085 [Streptomyces botrytidirepellens]
MHAVLVTLTIDPAQAPAAAGALMNDILPKLTAAPGFVSGQWLEPVDGRGMSILTFEDGELARAAVPLLGGSAPGVTIESVELRRVALTAP